MSVVIIGFLFVMIVLGLLSAVTSAIGAFFTRQAAREAAAAAESAREAAQSASSAAAQPVASAAVQSAPAATSQAAVGSGASPEEDPVLLAVITAAVHSMIGDRAHRIISIRSSGPGWAQEGRRQIFSSHRVR